MGEYLLYQLAFQFISGMTFLYALHIDWNYKKNGHWYKLNK